MIRRSFHEMSGWLRAGSCWPEREFTRQWDALNAERRKLPMTEIGKEYAFEGRYREGQPACPVRGSRPVATGSISLPEAAKKTGSSHPDAATAH